MEENITEEQILRPIPPTFTEEKKQKLKKRMPEGYFERQFQILKYINEQTDLNKTYEEIENEIYTRLERVTKKYEKKGVIYYKEQLTKEDEQNGVKLFSDLTLKQRGLLKIASGAGKNSSEYAVKQSQSKKTYYFNNLGFYNLGKPDLYPKFNTIYNSVMLALFGGFNFKAKLNGNGDLLIETLTQRDISRYYEGIIDC